MSLEIMARMPAIKHVWFDDGHWLEVYFNSDGIVGDTHNRKFLRKRPTVLETLKRRGLMP